MKKLLFVLAIAAFTACGDSTETGEIESTEVDTAGTMMAPAPMVTDTSVVVTDTTTMMGTDTATVR